MQDWINLLRWRHFVARLGGPQGVLGVLFCAALPVVPFGLLLASALGRRWEVLATRGGDATVTALIWLLVVAWTFGGLRS